MTTDPAPLPLSLVSDSEVSDPQSPEQLFISALLESGQYLPRHHRVTDVAIRGLRVVHEWCTDYQERAGQAPPVHLVLSKFPAFSYTPSVSPVWAARQVMEAEKHRRIRVGVSRALRSLAEEANDEAVGHLRETVAEVSSAVRPGTLMTDFSSLRDYEDRALCPIPPGRLHDLTGGHPAGQLWLVAALWEVGKTWKLLQHAVEAAEQGRQVIFFSLEMSTEEILERLHTVALRRYGTPTNEMSLDEREEAIEVWAQSAVPVEVRSPMAGRVDASVIASSVETGDQTLVVVDYIGKMYSLAGQYAGTDHVVQKVVSNELKAVAAERGIPVLAAAQLNRLGQLGGSIALEQDADLILELGYVGSSGDPVRCIRRNRLVKSRHTAHVRDWYSRFDASAGNFEDVTNDEAVILRANEESMFFG